MQRNLTVSTFLCRLKMIMKGQKRKLPPEDVDVSDRRSPIWESQRQFVFSVSLNKYQRSQELPEPSLRRSVLIANTLRQISLEAGQEAPADLEASEPHGSSSTQRDEEWENVLARERSLSPALSFHCSSARSSTSCHFGEPSVPMTEDEDEDWGSMSTDSDFSLSAAISSILTALDSTIDGSSQAAPRTALRSLENLPGASEGGMAWTKQGIRDWEQPGERSSHMSDVTVEDLFQDVDTSLLERDMGVLALGRGGGEYPAGGDLLRCLQPFPPSSLHPFSLSLNPSLRYLPSFSSFSPLSSSVPSAAVLSGQNQTREGFEFDHLVEILVES